MKARIKETGEIVDVKFSVHPNPAVEETYWWCKAKQESYHKWELDFWGVNIFGEFVDWEQRRCEIAKDAMNGILSAPIVDGVDPNPSVKDVAALSVRLADALIEELKGGSNEA